MAEANGKDLDWIFQQIAECNDSRATDAAKDIINTANDRDLRSQMIRLVTEYQTGKDSVAQHDAFENIITYLKDQYGLILIQGFRFGQGYQKKVSNEEFTNILRLATEAAQLKAEQNNNSTEQSEESPAGS